MCHLTVSSFESFAAVIEILFILPDGPSERFLCFANNIIYLHPSKYCRASTHIKMKPDDNVQVRCKYFRAKIILPTEQISPRPRRLRVLQPKPCPLSDITPRSVGCYRMRSSRLNGQLVLSLCNTISEIGIFTNLNS